VHFFWVEGQTLAARQGGLADRPSHSGGSSSGEVIVSVQILRLKISLADWVLVNHDNTANLSGVLELLRVNDEHLRSFLVIGMGAGFKAGMGLALEQLGLGFQ